MARLRGELVGTVEGREGGGGEVSGVKVEVEERIQYRQSG